MTKLKEKVPSLPQVKFSNKPKLIITKELKKRIDFLHKKVGQYEWSGELVTSEQGKITDLDNWTITAHDLFLNDLGSSGYTSYKVDQGSWKGTDIVQLYKQFPGFLTGQYVNQAAHIHTHHSMGAFFSSTDMENLEDRAKVGAYFTMLVVDFAGNYKAKVAIKMLVEGFKIETMHFANNIDEYEPFVMGEQGPKVELQEVLVIMDLDITIEEAEKEPEDWFEKRFNAVKAAEAVSSKPAVSYQSTPNKSYNHNSFVDYDDDYGKYDQYKDKGKYHLPDTKKKVSDMTDRQFELYEAEYDGNGENISKPEAFVWMNSAFAGVIDMTDITDPEDYLQSESLVEKKKEMEVKGEEVMGNLAAMFENLFPKSTDEFYLDSLKYLVDNILEPSTSKLASILKGLIKKEINKLTKLDKYLFNGN